jgi:hypothetical protein
VRFLRDLYVNIYLKLVLKRLKLISVMNRYEFDFLKEKEQRLFLFDNYCILFNHPFVCTKKCLTYNSLGINCELKENFRFNEVEIE